jgi:hypothetical protein
VALGLNKKKKKRLRFDEKMKKTMPDVWIRNRRGRERGRKPNRRGRETKRKRKRKPIQPVTNFP